MTEVSYTTDLETLREWVGRTEQRTEEISASSCRMLEHTLDRDAALSHGDTLPPLWHFISHLASAPLGSLDRDGHPRRGGFLPPVGLARRMWAGGRFEFNADIRLGDTVTKTSTVKSVEAKSGRTGSLCFVTVEHTLDVDGRVCLQEEQDLVYREDPEPGAPAPTPKPAPTEASFQRMITPSEVMLFRYSALTFNGHRIHYDRDYARDVEGYPGLVFHGPLTATLLADLAVSRTGRQLQTFSFRGMAPLFDSGAFTVAGNLTGDEVSLWAATPDGGMAMQATATLRP